ncbi:hypothetical protein C1I92_23635 [Jiangella anatolica]|uniref:Uncharacterized protein n=2 Tax=Jiangella anatolica TaxID=2670374 RepID=A0A2W2BKQ4_9ACTN|nr:hypothetical protein C1I92_23635 [Jiangella anatolica]
MTAQPGGASTTGEARRPGATGQPGGSEATRQARGAGTTGDLDQHGGTGQVGDLRSGRQADSRAGQTGAAITDPRAEAGPGVRRRPGEAGGRGGGADDLPDPRRWVARLTQSAIECLHGRRPVQQLVRWTAEPVYRDLTRRASTTEAAPAERPRIRSLRVCRVTASVAEASVVVQLGRAARSVAVAVRLEVDDARWVCTAFDLVEPGPAAAARREAQAGQRASHASSNATA